MNYQIQYLSGSINASDCIGNAWNLVKQNYWLFFGVSLVAILIVACIPFVNVFLSGPIMGGIFYCYLKAIRGEQFSFGEMFKGFDKFLPLMVVGLIQSLPELLEMGIRFTVNFADLGLRNADRNLYQMPDPIQVLTGGLTFFVVVLAIITFLLSVTVSLLFFFAVPLIMEHDLGVVDALKLSASAAINNLGGLILLFILECLVAIGGVLIFCVGILFVIPVLHAANAFAYRQVFPDTRQDIPNVPPTPDVYGGTYGVGQ